MVSEPDQLRGSDLLEFAGIAPIEFPVYPVTQHLAEKLHAYTLPRNQANTRVKDLADFITFIGLEQVAADHLTRSVAATFVARGTHPVPVALSEPPPSWRQPFAALAGSSLKVPLLTLNEAFERAAEFWNPFLAHEVNRQTWFPPDRTWAPVPVGL